MIKAAASHLYRFLFACLSQIHVSPPSELFVEVEFGLTVAYERYAVYHACAGQSLTLAAGEVVVKLDAQPWRSKAATCRSKTRYSFTDGRQVNHNDSACLALCMIVD